MKKTILTAFCLLALIRSNSQPYDTTEIGGFLHYLFQSVDKSQIPTGYLEELGMPGVEMRPFNGTANPAKWSKDLHERVHWLQVNIAVP